MYNYTEPILIVTRVYFLLHVIISIGLVYWTQAKSIVTLDLYFTHISIIMYPLKIFSIDVAESHNYFVFYFGAIVSTFNLYLIQSI